MFKRILKTLALTSLVWASQTFATTRYVNINNGSPSSPYTTWATAATSIQTAIDASSNGDTIIVTNGNYNSGDSYPAIGGIAGRIKMEKNVTVKSVNGPQYTFISGSGTNNYGLSGARRCVFMTNGVLSGFTLQNGSTLSSYNYKSCEGAGLFILGGTVTNCIMTRNKGRYGSGIYAYSIYDAVSIYDSIVSNNLAENSGSGVYMSTAYPSKSNTLFNVLSLRNHCLNQSGAVVTNRGAGFYISDSNNNARLYNCVAAYNSAKYGAGAYNVYANPDAYYNCTIISNAGNSLGTTYGGGVYSEAASSTIKNSIVYGNTASVNNDYYNCTFYYSCCSGIGTANGNTESEPSLNSDFTLAQGSLCKDAGNTNYPYYNPSIYGKTRLIGGSIDMGADELVPSGPSITFYPFITPLTYTSNAFDLVASSSSGPVAFSNSNPSVVTLTGSNVVIVGVGTTVFTAYVEPDGSNEVPEIVQRTLVVNKADQNITGIGFYDTYQKEYWLDKINLTNRIWVDSKLPVTFRMDPATNSHFLEIDNISYTGSCAHAYYPTYGVFLKIIMEQEGNEFYNPITYTNNKVLIGQGINYFTNTYPSAWSTQYIGASDFVLDGITIAGLHALSFSSGNTNIISISNNVAHIVGNAGSLSLTYDSDGITNGFPDLSSATAVVTINVMEHPDRTNQTIIGDWVPYAVQPYPTVGDTFNLTNHYQSNAELPLSFNVWGFTNIDYPIYQFVKTIDNPVYINPATELATILHYCAFYRVSVMQAGNIYYRPYSNAFEFYSLRKKQYVAFTNPTNDYHKYVNDLPFYLTATSSLPWATNNFSYLWIDGTYPPSVSVNSNVASLRGSEGVSIIYAYHSGVTPDGWSDYLEGDGYMTVTVTKVSQAITFPALGNQPISASPLTLSASADSGLTVSYTLDNPSIGFISGNLFYMTGMGSGNIIASQSGDSVYYSAVSITNPVTVSLVNIYVTTNGNDSNAGTSWATAFKTIQKAVDSALDGDHIWVSNGVYNTGLTQTSGYVLSNRVYNTKNIYITAVAGPTNTVIKGNNSGNYTYPYGVRCVYMGAGTLDGFTVTGGSTDNDGIHQNSAGGGINCGSSNSTAIIKNCIISNNVAYYGGGVYGGQLVNCIIANNSSYTYGGGCKESVLNNCTVSKNSIVSNTISGGGVYSCQVTNSIVYGNTAQAVLNNYFDGTFSYSCTYPSVSGTGNISSDPLFISSVSNIFRLAYGSPCINAGNNVYVAEAYDIRGRTRIIESIVDMGAYEYLKPAKPYFSPPSTNFAEITGPDLTVSITSSSPVVAIYFTTNGTVPTTSSFLYTTPISIETDTVVIAKTWFGEESSDTNMGIYIQNPSAPVPVISPASGSFSEPFQITISITPTNGFSVYYTTNGTIPSATNGFNYATTGPFTVSQTRTVKAVTIGTGYELSYSEAVYTFVVGTDYLVLSLTDFSTNTVSSLSYNTAYYKTNAIVFKRIYASAFIKGSPTNELGRDTFSETQSTNVITEDFYLSVFEITQSQWKRIMGVNPSWFTNVTYWATRPVEHISYTDIRGTNAGLNYPVDNNVDTNSFLGVLRQVTGIAFDLPTEAQWELACRAGTLTAWNNGTTVTNTRFDSNLGLLGRYYGPDFVTNFTQNSSINAGTAPVGSYAPNAYGLYDMHGNAWEWCLDRYTNAPKASIVTNSQGSTSGSYRVLKSGGWGYMAKQCRSAYRSAASPFSNNAYDGMGFRLACPKLVNPVSNIVIAVTNGTGSGTFAKGTIINISASVSASTELDYWEVNPSSADLGMLFSSNSTQTTITVPNVSVAITAHLRTKRLTLNYLANSGGYLIGNTTQTVNYGSSGSNVIAISQSGFAFSGWSDGGVGSNRVELLVYTNGIYLAGFSTNQVGILLINDSDTCSETSNKMEYFTLTAQPSNGAVATIYRTGNSFITNYTSQVSLDPSVWTPSYQYGFLIGVNDNPLDYTNEITSFVVEIGASNDVLTVTETDIDYPFSVIKTPAGISNVAGEVYLTPNKSIFRTNEYVYLQAGAYQGYTFLGWGDTELSDPFLVMPTNYMTSASKPVLYAFFITN